MKMMATRVVACAAAIGNFLNGWDTATLAGALLYIEPEFGLEERPILEGAVVAASLVGAAVSTGFAGPGADRLGRRPILGLAAALYTAAALLMLWSPSVWVLLAARIVGGVGVGLAVTTSPLYISEVSPAEIRGELNMLPQLLGTSGVFLAYVMVFVLSLTDDPSWRLMLAAMSLPSAAYLAVALFFLPESPRWLVSRGRTRDAKRVLQRLRDRDDVSDEMELLVDGLDVGEDPTLEEYIIEPVAPDAFKTRYGAPAAAAPDEENLLGGEEPFEPSLITLISPDGAAQYIAKPISRRTSSHGLNTLSRPTSVSQQLSSLGSFVDPMVGFMGSLKSSASFIGIEHHRADQLDAGADEHPVGASAALVDESGGEITSPLLGAARASFTGGASDHQHAGGAAPILTGNVVGSVGTDIGGGWRLGWQWSEHQQDGRGQSTPGSYKKIFMLEGAHQLAGSSSDQYPEHSSYADHHERLHHELADAGGDVQQSFPAVAIVSRPSQLFDVVAEDQAVGPAVVHPAETAARSKAGPSWSELFEGGVRQALIVGVTLQILEQLGGINAVLNFAPEILQESGAEVLLSSMGIGSESASVLASAATQLIAIPFIIISMRQMDVIGRRNILLYTIPILVLALASLIIISVVPASDAVFSVVSFVSFVTYVIFFVSGFGPIPNMLCAEIFPTRVRGLCIGICQAAMWITNILITELFPTLDASLGTAATFGFFAFFCIVAWVFVYVKVPETKGLPLEVIVEIFSIRAAERKKLKA